jgi:hypothetical protein
MIIYSNKLHSNGADLRAILNISGDFVYFTVELSKEKNDCLALERKSNSHSW